MSITIKRLEIEGFRGYKEKHTFKFVDGINEIQGGNGRGKSSIMEAISFGLGGVDKYGKERGADRLMNKNCSEFRIALFIEVDGQICEIERLVAKLKSKIDSRILINRMQGSQDQIERIIGDRRRFLASFLPKFLLSLTDKELEAEFVTLIPLPDDEEVFALLSEDDPKAVKVLKNISLVDPRLFISKETDELKQNKETLIRLEGKEEEIKETLLIEIPDEIPIDMTEIESLKQSITAIEGLKPAAPELSSLQVERQTLLTEYTLLQSGLKFDEHIVVCENCGHHINLHADQEKANEEITNKMLAVKEKGETVAGEIKRLQQEHVTQVEAFKEVNDQSLLDLRRELQELEGNLYVTQQHNMKVRVMKTNLQQAKERQLTIRKEQKDLAQEIEQSELRIKAAKAFNIKRCELQMQTIEQNLDRASVRLFEIVRSTGEIKPAFKVEFDGKPVRVLSTSEEILCFLELSKLIRIFTKTNYPVFVDWAESIEMIPDQGTQTLIARVVPQRGLVLNGQSAIVG